MDTSVKPFTSKERSDDMGQQDVSSISSHKIGELKAIIKKQSLQIAFDGKTATCWYVLQ